MSFEHFFPHLHHWVFSLAPIWPAPMVKAWFGFYEVAHIVSLVVISGAVLLVSLRLIGAGLTEEPASVIYRNLRVWLAIGVVGVLASGLLLGMADARRIYPNVAFFVKMIALLAALIFTYGVLRPVAKADGLVGTGAKIGALIAFTIWGAAIWIFSTVQGVTPGMIYFIIAGALITLIATTGRIRWLFLAVLVLLVVGQEGYTHLALKPFDYDKINPANIWFMRAIAAWVLVIAGYNLFARKTDAGALAKLIGYATILVWVTVAAAGRWIAFA